MVGAPPTVILIGQTDPNQHKKVNADLDESRNNRRRSIEGNILAANLNFPNSGLGKSNSDNDNGFATERLGGSNGALHSQLHKENESQDAGGDKRPNRIFKRASATSSQAEPEEIIPDANKTNAEFSMISSHNRLSNRSLDNTHGRKRYSPTRVDVTYKKYVGDINSMNKGHLTFMKHSLPSKVDIPATHPALMKSLESQRYKKQQRDMEENEDILNGDVEIAVDSIQTHIRLVLRLIKATHKSLEEYKSD